MPLEQPFAEAHLYRPGIAPLLDGQDELGEALLGQALIAVNRFDMLVTAPGFIPADING